MGKRTCLVKRLGQAGQPKGLLSLVEVSIFTPVSAETPGRRGDRVCQQLWGITKPPCCHYEVKFKKATVVTMLTREAAMAKDRNKTA